MVRQVLAYEEWEQTVPEEIKSDSVWRMQAYRLALYAADIGWEDVVLLARDRRTIGIAEQLFRSLCSISANLAEGYSRSSQRDQARFYEYALGSAREARDWYFKTRHVLCSKVICERISLLTKIIRLLLTMIPQRRSVTLHDEGGEYGA
jgi:four helix bundle protein